jgi:hypothetical protein
VSVLFEIPMGQVICVCVCGGGGWVGGWVCDRGRGCMGACAGSSVEQTKQKRLNQRLNRRDQPMLNRLNRRDQTKPNRGGSSTLGTTIQSRSPRGCMPSWPRPCLTTTTLRALLPSPLRRLSGNFFLGDPLSFFFNKN